MPNALEIELKIDQMWLNIAYMGLKIDQFPKVLGGLKINLFSYKVLYFEQIKAIMCENLEIHNLVQKWVILYICLFFIDFGAIMVLFGLNCTK